MVAENCKKIKPVVVKLCSKTKYTTFFLNTVYSYVNCASDEKAEISLVRGFPFIHNLLSFFQTPFAAPNLKTKLHLQYECIRAAKILALPVVLCCLCIGKYRLCLCVKLASDCVHNGTGYIHEQCIVRT